MGSVKNQHQPSNAVRSLLPRRSANLQQELLQFHDGKKHKVVGAQVMDMQCLPNGIQKSCNIVHNYKSK